MHKKTVSRHEYGQRAGMHVPTKIGLVALLWSVPAPGVETRERNILSTPYDHVVSCPDTRLVRPRTGHTDDRRGLPRIRTRVIAPGRAVEITIGITRASPDNQFSSTPDSNVTESS